MLRLTTISALFTAGLVLAGCESDAGNPLAPGDPALHVVQVEAAQLMVPIEWSFHARAIGTEMIPCLLPDGQTLEFPPGNPIYVSVLFAITGNVSHLGRIDEDASVARIHECHVGLTATGMPESLGGPVSGRLVGPQGDEIELAGTLTQLLFAGYAVGEWDIVGGEGRFAGARGYIDTIEYPATDGSGSEGTGSGMVTRPDAVKGGRT